MYAKKDIRIYLLHEHYFSFAAEFEFDGLQFYFVRCPPIICEIVFQGRNVLSVVVGGGIASLTKGNVIVRERKASQMQGLFIRTSLIS